jgi:poly-gamma-glutamate capsule biosynthesis protein CapA/YwtB (metallophosphatase superfamily)
MRDEPPLGILSANDVIAHQLEGPPELLPLGAFLAARKKTAFYLLEPRRESPAATLVFGGDVMLGRRVGQRISAGADPFAEIAPILQKADLAWVNLECVIAEAGQPQKEKPVLLRAPLAAIECLRRAGVKAVGLGNNHAADFGTDGLREMRTRLEDAGLQPTGAALDRAEAFRARIVTAPSGVRVALLPFLCEPGSPLIASSEDRPALARAIAEARAQADCVVALPHWGDENQAAVNEEQRGLARWLIDRGVDLVVGAGPHCVQAADAYRGRPIFYSLGNLIFDGPGPSPAWSRGELLKVEVSADGRIIRTMRIPCRIDDDGTARPELQSSVEGLERGK